MADEWYYWHDSDVLGPFSGKELVDLARTGKIIPTDTVWRGDVERGVMANCVHNLFAPEPAVAVAEAPAPAEPAPAAAVAAVAGVAPGWDARPAVATRPRRASAGKGAILVAQDGTTVKFRKKCTTCGFEDSSWRSIPIPRGTTRVSFYCPKCRRNCSVEVHGQSH